VVGRVAVFANDQIFGLLRGRKAVSAADTLWALPVKLDVALVALTAREFKAVNVVLLIARGAIKHLLVLKYLFSEVAITFPTEVKTVIIFSLHDSSGSDCAVSKGPFDLIRCLEN
jgi:hypothetical protein